MRKNLKRGIRSVMLLALAGAARIWGQADYMPPMTGWPANIQLQWQVQGEYYGSQTQNNAVHLGAWLVANGGTGYGLVVLPGGLLTLPGQPDGGWDQVTRYQGTNGPAAGTLNGTAFNVTTSTGGFVADSITGTGEARTLYLHNTNGSSYVLQRVRRHSPTRGFDYTKVKTLPGGSGVVSLWDSSTGIADLSKWTTQDNTPQIKYNYLYRGIRSVEGFGSMLFHIEFESCFNPASGAQARANSGVYVQNHYEVQVLDNFGLSGALNEYGAIYETAAPSVNAELPPQVTLQTYDIYLTQRTSGNWGDAAGAATFTIYANGVLVQNATPCPNLTAAGNTAPGPGLPGPFYLQNHNNEIVFNNIWVVPNATVTSLPYSSILAAAAPSTAVNPYIITPLLQSKGLSFGIEGNFDMTGRKILRHGAVLSIQPTASFNPKTH